MELYNTSNYAIAHEFIAASKKSGILHFMPMLPSGELEIAPSTKRYRAHVGPNIDSHLSELGAHPVGTIATIELVPKPIELGEVFMRAVLGVDTRGVRLEVLIVDPDKVTFLAEVALRGYDGGDFGDIFVMRQRVEDLANDPNQAILMLQQRPYGRE